jgi:glucan 1,3-beta-glucosidase
MKKICITSILFLIILTISGCNGTSVEQVEVIDFYGMDYGDVVRWANERDLVIAPSSAYNDDVEPNSVFEQDIEAGTKVDPKTEIAVVYSRGFDPNGVIIVPDFSGQTEEDIRAWLAEYDIDRYEFFNTFSNDILEDGYIGYEVTKTHDSEDDLRKDRYTFFFSRGPLFVEEVTMDEPGTVRGVNLGGWFVLEGWMTPDLFEGVSGSDETIFLQEKPNAEAEIINHWDTFITEEDFQWLQDKGVEYVRLPIPWWMFGVEDAYPGREHNVDYVSSVFYIDRAMTWAEDYGINVLIDLHTAPGGQNGFDNGGLTGILEWPNSENVDLTLVEIEKMAVHFTQFDSYWGFQVLNEPGWGVNMNTLQNYYKDAYDIIRFYDSDVWIAFHDGFRSYMDYSWKPFFENNNFTNVFFDIHLYHVFGDWETSPGVPFTLEDHLYWVDEEDHKHIRRYEGVVPVVIGEWSVALPGSVFDGMDENSTFLAKKAFASAQLNAFEDGMGYFFWNYKIDADSHKEWDFVRMVELGYFPSDFSPET